MKLVVALLIASLSLSDAPRSAAAPGVIIVTGKPLTKRVVLDDWQENLRLMTGMGRHVRPSDDSLRVRPSMNVAMYWGTRSKESAATLPDTVPLISAPYGAQRGTFYPATPGREALWVFGSVPYQSSTTRVLGPTAIGILRRHGIPTELARAY